MPRTQIRSSADRFPRPRAQRWGAETVSRSYPTTAHWTVVTLYATAGWSALAFVCLTSSWASATVGGSAVPGGKSVLVALLYTYPWVPVSVGVYFLSERFPLTHGPALRHGAVQLLAAVPIIAARTALFYGLGRSVGLLRAGMPFGLAFFTYLWESVMIYVLVLGVVHAILNKWRAHDHERGQSVLETQLARAELQTLKMQLHPHFLFNTLHAISALVHRDADRAERMVASLSDLLRQSLLHRDSQEVTLGEEISVLHSYLDIERTRFGRRLTTRVRIADQLLNAYVPHLMLQPLVENAIRHGVAKRREGGSVDVAACAVGDRLRITVQNDGAEIQVVNRSGGVGLSNTRSRLERLYGLSHTFRFEQSDDRKTCVHIEIPLRRADARQSNRA